MKYCTNCGANLKEETKFCTNCGTPVQKNEKRDDVAEKREENFQTNTLEHKVKKPFPLNKVLLGIGVLVVLFFFGKIIISNTDISEPLFDIDKEVAKVEGKWHDPTGVLLKDKTAIIKFKSVGSIAEGKDKNNNIKISMIPINKNRYYATTVLYGIEGEFDVTYYQEENKLVFFSTLTKTSWDIKKIKQ
jgi:hypothetical protein